eukprot:TRINITY_DN1679_c0_g1_i44.p1 TRINITY_DN1679_c0_g1~~TRINITY_DN1679_c0_g1_i44.p1  ORF type:complete len:304 (-),score=52.68 TRINITY_DN1679_c0_g1_i44:96-1007(-)
MSSDKYGKQTIQITTISSRTRQPYNVHYSAPVIPLVSSPYEVANSREHVRGDGRMQNGSANPYLVDSIENKESKSNSERAPAIGVPEELPLGRLNFFGILISGLIIIVSIGYIVISVLFHFDKRGKEAYYTNNPDTELTLTYVFANPPTGDVAVKTDYWGWFERSHDEDSGLKDYDVYYLTLTIGVVGGTCWVFLGAFEILKYKSNSVGRAVAGMVLCVVGFAFLAIGNAFIYYRFYKFRKDTKDHWKKCNCDKFENKYCGSMYYYTVLSFALICLTFLKFLISLCFCCCDKGTTVSPVEETT